MVGDNKNQQISIFKVLYLGGFFLLNFTIGNKILDKYKAVYEDKIILKEQPYLVYVSKHSKSFVHRELSFYSTSSKKDTIKLTTNFADYLSDHELNNIISLSKGSSVTMSILVDSKREKYLRAIGIKTADFHYKTGVRLNFMDYYILIIALFFFLGPFTDIIFTVVIKTFNIKTKQIKN